MILWTRSASVFSQAHTFDPTALNKALRSSDFASDGTADQRAQKVVPKGLNDGSQAIYCLGCVQKVDLSRRDVMKDRGRDDCIGVAPPSEPDRRFSRIRLSS
jgi:hypothetical protein